ncbi:MAG: HAMP domain-containing histidine kinase [Bacilli bacterium]|jgi:signal transduction histidine kinase|nr:HAMP domain-containing histidine kinase [Bacilli bacterium]
MKDKLSKSWRFVLIGIAIFYFVIVLLFVYSLLKITDDYNEIQVRQTYEVKQKIQEAINTNSSEAFKSLKNNKPIEFAVILDNKNLYSTIPIANINNYSGNLSRNAIAYEEKYDYHANGKKYEIWLLEYYPSPQSTFNKWGFFMFIPVAVLAILNMIICLVIFNRFVRPLKSLKINIDKIAKFQFDLISNNRISEYDRLSRQMVDIASELGNYFDNSQIVYSSLEKNLSLSNKKLENKNNQLARLTHDLKGPINNIKILINNVDNANNINYNHKILLTCNNLISDINEIIKIAYQEEEPKLEISNINIISLLFNIITEFEDQFKNKNIYLDIDTDEEINIVNDIHIYQQLFRNIISNICKYTPKDGEAKIEIYQDNNNIIMSFFNTSQPYTQEQLAKIFNLYYRINTNVEGSGTGLYTIKNIVEQQLHSQVNFFNHQNGVLLLIRIEVI